MDGIQNDKTHNASNEVAKRYPWILVLTEMGLQSKSSVLAHSMHNPY